MRVKAIVVEVVLCAVYFGYVKNENILAILGIPSKSHFVMYEALTNELAKRGHNVDVVTTFPKKNNITSLNYIGIPNIFHNKRSVSIEEYRDITVQGIMDIMLGGEFQDYNLCERLFRIQTLSDLKKSEKRYDLLILEVFTADCLFGFAHLMKVPVVGLTSSVNVPWGASRIGNPDNPSYIPNYFRPLLPEMSLYQRIWNTITLVHTKLVHNGYMQIQNKEAKKFFGDNLPILDDLVSNCSLMIVNSHFSLNQARPTVPNFIEVSGLHIGVPKPISQELQDFIGESKFIYFSLSTVSGSETVSLEKFQQLCDIFENYRLKVIWRVDREKLPKELIIPDIVFTTKWASQLDILCHPNISFFITHNGLLGTQEAVYCGVPMLSVPLFADQYQNAKAVVNKGIAKEISLESIAKDELNSTIKELLENESFRTNAKILSDQFRDRPQKPLDEAVYWIEYVVRHNGVPQMRSKAADLRWYQYYLLDVLSIFVFCIAIIMATFIFLALLIVQLITGTRKSRVKIE